ncbi:MAG: flagellar assembly protein FliW [Chloroflexota bacterium]
MNNENLGRTITTAQFGEIEIEPRHIFHFPQGLLGFEELCDFVLISEEETLPFKWLISVEQPDIGFPLLSPWLIELDYSPGKSYNLDEQVFFAIVTLGDGAGRMTANLKAPIILNVREQKGEQVILPTDKYSPEQIIGEA